MSIALRAGILYFLAVFGAGLLLGTVRMLWVAPRIGARAAELLEMPVMLTVMVISAWLIVRRMHVPAAPRFRLAMGVLALGCMLLAEFTVVLELRGLTLADYFETFDPVTGRLFYLLLGLSALLPLLVQSERWYFVHATALGVSALAAVFFGFAYAGYIADIDAAHKRIAQGSYVVHTACGPVEYAERGKGPVLLLVHGSGGGFDQGLEIAEELAHRGFRVVAPSRFGYLRTPMPGDASPEAQADAHACLLDALQIEHAAIAGVSAGAPSAMQFSLRHSQRADALILLVPLAYIPRSDPPKALSPAAQFMFERAVKSDFLYWLALRHAPDLVLETLLATPAAILEAADDNEKRRVARTMENILPLSRRQAGLLNDGAIAQSLPRYDLERIATRTLVISARDDLYGTFESAGYTASNIRGAHFVGYASGGHLWVGQHRWVLAELTDFLRGVDTSVARASQ